MISSNEEVEKYILTPEEEKKAIEHAIEREKEHKRYKLSQINGALPDLDKEMMDAIDWESRIDKKQVLSTANSNKHYELFHLEQRKKQKEEADKKRQEVITLHTAQYFFKIMQWVSVNNINKNLIVDNQTTPLIKIICFFFSKDKRFETELKYDLNKGLLFRGIAGLGKTYLIKCISENELNPVQIHSMVKIAEDVSKFGEYEIPNGRTVCLDDVGSEEPVVNYYGTKINWFKEYLELYYLNKPNEFNRLIISTNNSASLLEEKYGFRVRSRIKDMFNIIDLVGEDLRGR